MWSGSDGNWNQAWPSSVTPNDGEIAETADFSTTTIISHYQMHGTNPCSNPEQVDWGALAQQWIQMQHQPQDQPQQQPTLQQSLPLQVIPANPIANIPIPNQFNSSSEPIEHVPPTGNAYSESGNVLPPAQQSNYWNAEQLTWNNPTLTNQAWLGPNARQKETFDYGHNPSQGESFSSSNSAQTYDYNHRGSNNFTYDQPSYNDQYWEQDSAEPVDVEFNKNRSSWKEVCLPETPQIDMVKRKSLPPWIREGLEKMEREKLKKIDEENEKLLKLKSQNDKVDVGEEKVESVWPKRSRFESESEEDNPADENKSVNENSNDESPSHPIVRSPSPKEVPVMTEEEKEQERLSKMRRWLTEILLEVTNEEIRKVVLEVTEKAISRQSLETKHLASSSALASIAGNFGHGNYESDSEEDNENEKLHSESDSDVETIHEKARRKRSDFERRQSERIYEEEEHKTKSKESKSFGDRDSSKSDDPRKDSTKTRESDIDFSKVSDADSSFKYHFEKKYSEIPGLDVSIKSENYDHESSSEKSEIVKKPKKQSSRSENKNSKKQRKSRSRSRDQRWSRSSSRGYKKSKPVENYSKSRSNKRKRGRSRNRYKSRSRSSDKRDRRISHSIDRRRRSISSGSSSSTVSNRKKYRSRSRDRRSHSRHRRSRSRDKSRTKKSRRKSRSRSRSNSSKRISKYKSGKSRSGKKSS